MVTNKEDPNQGEVEEKSFFKIIVHSFFIIPFLIAVFCVLMFAGINLLTRENRTVYDYLEDVKTGGLTKRWQGAFELSKILSNHALLPKEERFSNELISAFEQSRHDDNRIRQYLALAMGRTGRKEFVKPLMDGLNNEKEENLAAIIYALGALKDKQASPVLSDYLDHSDPRIRSIAVVALGTIADGSSKGVLQGALQDKEPNVQWGAAISLAQMGDSSGKVILLKLLSREYLEKFPEVDPDEQTNLLLSALQAASNLKDDTLMTRINELSKTDKNMKVRSAAMEILER